MTKDTVHKLLKLAEKAKLKEKIESMFTGEHINVTEDRPVLHVALRAPREQVCFQQPEMYLPFHPKAVPVLSYHHFLLELSQLQAIFVRA